MATNVVVVTVGVALAMGGLGGCAGSAGGPEEGWRSEARLSGPGCDDFYCGNNSPIVAGAPFWELDATGQPYAHGAWNSAGLAIAAHGFYNADGEMKIDVDRDVLLGLRDGDVLKDDRLIGATLKLIRLKDNHFYYLLITGTQQTNFRISEPIDRPVQTYHFKYYRDDADPLNAKDLCPATDDPDWTALSGQAVVFAGDRYDKDQKTVSETAPGGWFNIACAGTAVAKMHFMAHTRASEDTGHHTELAQRQALMKMFAADYCGSGMPFTEAGIGIRFKWKQLWQEEHGFDWRDPIESVWTDTGAVCLSVPRMSGGGRFGTATIPEIAAECHRVGRTLPPPCDGDFFANWPAHGYIISAKPTP